MNGSMKKKALFLLPALAVLLALVLPSFAAGTEFSDVPKDAWYAEAVGYVAEKGILKGVGGGRFDPEGTLTRAMLATALYRAEGEPAVSGGPAFPDARTDAWYSDAVAWASESGLVRGYGNGLFGTGDPVSVEQMEVILARYTGGSPAWTGDPAKAHAATRAQVAAALYNALRGKDGAPETESSPGAGTAEDAAETSKQEDAAMNKITVSFHDHTYPATLADNSSAAAFAELLQSKGGSLTIHASDFGGFEKVGPLGAELPRNDEQITTSAGDIILYQGDQITLYYAQNSWSFTRLGRLDDPTGLQDALGSGDVDITFALA